MDWVLLLKKKNGVKDDTNVFAETGKDAAQVSLGWR